MRINWLGIKYLLAAILLMFSIIGGIAFNALNKDQNLRADLLRSGERASGKIVDIRGARTRKTFIDMEFRIPDGRVVKASYHNRMTSPEINRLIKGMSVEVVYDSADPKRAIPAPYKTVPQRDVSAELIAFLQQIALTLLICSPLIVGLALFSHWRSLGRTKT